MRLMFIILFVMSNYKLAYAQGNLQFNQIIRTSFIGTSPATQNSPAVIFGTITVPLNKVWKIESGSIMDSAQLNTQKIMCLSVDGQLLYSVYNGGGGGGTAFYVSPPIWLGTGTYNITVSNNDGNYPNVICVAKISAIEYNIVQ